MLILTRKVGETIKIDGKAEIIITRIGGCRVGLGITAAPDVRILRGEIEPFDPPAETEEPPRDY